MSKLIDETESPEGVASRWEFERFIYDNFINKGFKNTWSRGNPCNRCSNVKVTTKFWGAGLKAACHMANCFYYDK